MNTDKVLLMIGSPKKSSSTSESICSYLEEQLLNKGMIVTRAHLKKAMSTPDDMKEFFIAIDNADILIFTAPLYVDCMPAHVTEAMEKIYDRYHARPAGKKKKLLAIVNCGMPDSYHNDVAIGIFHHFAELSGFEWLGGLSLGGGSIIDGRPLSAIGNDAKSIMKSLNMTADALAAGQPVPAEALKLMSRSLIPPFMPKFLVAWIGNAGFKKTAKEKGVLNKFMDRPYEQA